MFRITGLVVIISLFITLSALLVLWPSVLSPLIYLAAIQNEMKEDLSSVQLPPRYLSRMDEMGDLYRSFLSLAARVTKAIQETRAARENLQFQVEERTKELLQTQADYREIFENALQGIVITTPEGKFENANPAFVQMMGFNSLEDLKNQISNIGHQMWVHPDKRTEMLDILKAESRASFETELQKKDGEPIWVSMAVWAKRI